MGDLSAQTLALQESFEEDSEEESQRRPRQDQCRIEGEVHPLRVPIREPERVENADQIALSLAW